MKLLFGDAQLVFADAIAAACCVAKDLPFVENTDVRHTTAMMVRYRPRRLLIGAHLPTKVTFLLASVAVVILSKSSYGGDHEENRASTGRLPDLVGTRICDLQIGRGRQEARGRRAQELHDEVREGCSDDLRDGLQGQETRGRGKDQPHEEV